MKKILVIFENGEKVELIDNDTRSIESLSKELSELMGSETICSLKTDTHICLFKPSKVISICIEETDFVDQGDTLVEE